MNAQKNVTYLFPIADVAPVTTAAPTVARTLGVRREGQLLCDASALNAAGESRFQILYLDANSKLHVSPMLDYNNIITKSHRAPVSAASQVSSIGYNGTDGDIVATNSGNYLLTIGIKIQYLKP